MVINLTDTTVDDREVEAVARVLRSGWLTMGPEVAAFEKEFAVALGSRQAAAVSNGTVALHLAYRVAGIRGGDEVLLPALTFVATMNAALYLGARPVLIDCASEDDLTLSPADLERKITPKTRLIVTMAYGGFCPDMERIVDVARARGIPVIEDACHAPLAELGGRKIGTFGLASTWSFYGNKNLTTGEGGMVVTDDDEVDRHVRLLRSHAMTSPTWDRRVGHSSGYDVLDLGYNYRLDEIRAAIGRVQLSKLSGSNARRAEAAGWLREALEPLRGKGLTMPFAHPRGKPVHHLFPVLLPEGVDRDVFRARLDEREIQTSVHYTPLDRLTYPSKALGGRQELPVVRRIESRLVSLPMGPTLTRDQVSQIAEAVAKALVA